MKQILRGLCGHKIARARLGMVDLICAHYCGEGSSKIWEDTSQAHIIRRPWHGAEIKCVFDGFLRGYCQPSCLYGKAGRSTISPFIPDATFSGPGGPLSGAPTSPKVVRTEEVAETSSGVGSIFSWAYFFSASLSILSAIVRRRIAACTGLNWATGTSCGRFVVIELNLVAHCVGRVARWKIVLAEQEAGIATERAAIREAPVRSMLCQRVR